MTEEFKKGSKYLANVEQVLDSIKHVNTDHITAARSEHDSLSYNMIKSLCTIIDTQNDILKYIVSHDSKASILAEGDDYSPGEFIWVEREKGFCVIKEIIDKDFIKIHVIRTSQDIIINLTEI